MGSQTTMKIQQILKTPKLIHKMEAKLGKSLSIITQSKQICVNLLYSKEAG